MTSNDHFFQERKPAAVLKHGVLRRYSEIFATMTGSRSPGRRVVFVDGYAGPGRYGSDEVGSPILALQMAEKAARSGRSVECVFIERDAGTASELRSCLAAEAPTGVSYSVLQGDVGEHLPAVMVGAGSVPLLAFLDPFGTALPKDVMDSTVFARPVSAKTEVLLNMNLEMVRRIGGQVGAADGPGVQATLAHLDRFLGGVWWREVFSEARLASEGSAARAAEAVVHQFCANVESDTGFRSFSVPVRRRPLHEPLFLLVLFFRADVALWKFSECVSLANADWRKACVDLDLTELRQELARMRQWGQDSLFGDDESVRMAATASQGELRALEERDTTEWIAEIERNLSELAHAGRAVPLKPNIRSVYGRTLGLARDTHVKKAWDRIAAQGHLSPRDKSVKYAYDLVLTRPLADPGSG